jgi:hypothetical protein
MASENSPGLQPWGAASKRIALPVRRSFREYGTKAEKGDRLNQVRIQDGRGTDDKTIQDNRNVETTRRTRPPLSGGLTACQTQG